MEIIHSFDDCIELSNKKKHLILGNGFSVDLFPHIFNYRKLAEKITDPKIQMIFREFNTTDFEYVVYKLTESLRILEFYDQEKDIYRIIKEDSDRLKEILITVITESHPENPGTITFEQYRSCFEFLKHFEDEKEVNAEITTALLRREAFYRMRANLPANRLLRFIPVVKHATRGSYQLEEGGKWWRPLLGDLFE